MVSGSLDLRRVVRAAGHSYRGLKDAVLDHTAFRQELFLGIVLTPIAIWLGDDGVQRAVLVGSLFILLIVELVNSAIETVVDRIGQEHNELSGRAKDLGSAAVLVSLLAVPVVWALVLLG